MYNSVFWVKQEIIVFQDQGDHMAAFQILLIVLISILSK